MSKTNPNPADIRHQNYARKTLDSYIGQTLEFGWNDNWVDDILDVKQCQNFTVWNHHHDVVQTMSFVPHTLQPNVFILCPDDV